MKIVWSPLAIDRASEEAAFIASDKPQAAKRWLEGLFSAVDRLASFPLSGKRLPELRSAEYRQITYRSHRIVYRIEEGGVAILTVRRFKQQLRPEELLRSGGLTPRQTVSKRALENIGGLTELLRGFEVAMRFCA